MNRNKENYKNAINQGAGLSGLVRNAAGAF